MKRSEKNHSAVDIKVYNIEDGKNEKLKLGFISAEYTEMINGVLPRLVVTFMCDLDLIPINVVDVRLEIYIEEGEDIMIPATVDDMTYSKNVVTLFFSLAPRDFYYTAKSTKYSSPREVVEKLYPFEDRDSFDFSSIDGSKVELNQVGVTDYKFLNNILRSSNSPSVYAYTLTGINMNSIGNIRAEEDLDFLPTPPNYNPEVVQNEVLSDSVKFINLTSLKYPYSVDESSYDYSQDFLLHSQPNSYISSQKSKTLEWGGIKTTYNEDLTDLIVGLVENTRSLKDKKLSFRVTAQKNMGIKAGDLVVARFPTLELRSFIVSERMAILGSEIKYNYKLIALTREDI
jgi:hypothetical protein